jgi:plasmid maintenance system antidote protein VapI
VTEPPSSPGDTIQDIMDERGISRFKLGKMLNLREKLVMDLLEGRFLLDNDMACRLSEALGSTVTFWEMREKNYRDTLQSIREELLEEDKPGCFGAYGLPSCRTPGCVWFERCKQSREDY